MEHVILVDESDREVGRQEKLAAHRAGALHRAFSIFIFNAGGQLMLQKRAKGKYHSELLWSNTCCSHPRPGEDVLAAGKRRLQEEMGFTTDLRKVFSFSYRHAFANGLIENEYDHVLVGRYEGVPKLNSEEAADWKWLSQVGLERQLSVNPDAFSAWLKIILGQFNNQVSALSSL